MKEFIKRIREQDSTLDEVALEDKEYTDENVCELINCLIENPNLVKRLFLCSNKLSDITGVKLGRFLRSSTTIEVLCLHDNLFGEATYIAISAALCLNRSLKCLRLYGNKTVDKGRIDRSFINVLMHFSERPPDSVWSLYMDQDDFRRLNSIALANIKSNRSIVSSAAITPLGPFKWNMWPSTALEERIGELKALLVRKKERIAALEIRLAELELQSANVQR